MDMPKLFTSSVTATNIVDDPSNGDIIGAHNSQLLFGEGFEMIGEDESWIHGKSLIDGYEGYAHKSKMCPLESEPSHFINNLLSHIYPEPSFKTHPICMLSFLSRITIANERQDGFVRLKNSGWVFEGHIAPLSKLNKNNDFVASALKLEDTPYLYGGRTVLGIDCSALVQLSCLYIGQKCPRDTNQQLEALGTPVDQNQIQRGDIAFFKGHVGIMVDSKNILNASARSMDTRIELLSTVSDAYNGIISVKRLNI